MPRNVPVSNGSLLVAFDHHHLVRRSRAQASR